MKENFYIYILTNKRRTVLYTGMTSNLVRRIYEHKSRSVEGFTAKYNVDQLVYFERAESPVAAITREKQIKDFRRSKKIDLIKKFNPAWKDLYEQII